MSWYDEHRKRVEAEAKNLPNLKEIGQNILMLKAVAIEKLEKDNKEGCFTFKAGEKFGFSEILVNHLMQYAYVAGRRDIDKKSYDTGRDVMRKEMLDLLDAKDIDDD